MLLEVITNLEHQKKRPVYFVEILQSLKSLEGGVEKVRDTTIDLFNLFKDDRVFCDSEMNMYSVNESLQRNDVNLSEFELCSARMQRLYPSYDLSDEGVF